MIQNIKTKEHGFTIVELLVVIVVIGILAAITIVSYSGVSSKARSAQAQSAANNTLQKLEAYNADEGTYPSDHADLTTNSSAVYYLSGVALLTAAPNAPENPSSVAIYKCGTDGDETAPTTFAGITTANTGWRVDYWDYGADAPGVASISTGQVSGTYDGDAVGCGIMPAS